MNSRREAPAVNGLVVSGLAQIAAGALTGFPYAATVYKPELLAKAGVQAPGRIRQLHLDLIIMGGIVTAAGLALPRLPRAISVPLAIGCWTNALAFAPVAIRPSVEHAKPYRAALATSFVTTTASWVAVAGIALHRWSNRNRQPSQSWSARSTKGEQGS
ncbi:MULTISPECIES: hypothetical protein [Kribbella]|uniref:Fluoride ion transporter CrcB n=1 Tax=Kribbella sancticallisti TaxID=460087 RepID=A0ABN2EDS7_9ACTN|nr:hypothetical protein [Kribbella catacumbae]